MDKTAKGLDLTLTFALGPLTALQYSISGILGSVNARLLGEFFTPSICKKVDVMISELVHTAMENTVDKTANFSLEIKARGGYLSVKVKYKAALEKFQEMKKQVDAIKQSKDPKALLKQAIRERRARQLKGGLELPRLAAENSALLSAVYYKKKSLMTIGAKIVIKGE